MRSVKQHLDIPMGTVRIFKDWSSSQLIVNSFDDPSGFMAAYQQNASCNPITSRDTPCVQGNYVEYAIEVHEASDVIAGVKFAQDSNVRLVIKNTGHE
jgi:hypothetical protein